MASNQSRPTKAERRAAARAQAQALREEQERRAKRAAITRRAAIGVGALGVVGVGTALYLQSRKGIEGGSIAEGKANTEGVLSVVLSDGSWIYGRGPTIDETNSSSAPVEVYFDYACPHCAEFEELHANEIVQLLNEGKITLVLRPCKILGQQWTDLAMNAMGVVLDQEPDKAWEFHGGVASLLVQASQAQDASGLTVEGLVGAAQRAGVSDAVSAGFQAAVSANTYGAWTQLGTKTYESRGISGTPTVLISGEQVDLRSIATATGLTDHIAAQAA